MSKLTLRDFEGKRKNSQQEGIQIIVSMGTCGIAAGGDKIFEYFSNEIPRRELKNVTLGKTGCLGTCADEPNVIVRISGKADVLYGNVTVATAEKILNKHVGQGSILNEIPMAFSSEDLFAPTKQGGKE
jgi:(2Fe-2S) ferredoxin